MSEIKQQEVAPSTEPSVKSVDSSVKVHQFMETLVREKIYFQLIALEGSLFVWVGNANANMTHIDVAIQTKFVSALSVDF